MRDPSQIVIPRTLQELLVWLNGIWRSFTFYFVLVVGAWPLYADQIHKIVVPDLVSEDAWTAYVTKKAAIVLALIALALRIKSSQSIAEKGLRAPAAPVAPPPP